MGSRNAYIMNVGAVAPLGDGGRSPCHRHAFPVSPVIREGSRMADNNTEMFGAFSLAGEFDETKGIHQGDKGGGVVE